MNDPLFIFWGVYVLIAGLCIGSFLNVVALRAFSQESIVLPPSKCPKCNNKLKWYHNIPVLSYLFLRGKCAFCKCKISPQYPIVELTNGILYLASYIIFGASLKTIFACIFISYLIVMSITDIKEQVVFDKHIYSFIAVMYISTLFNVNNINWWQGLIAIAIAFIVFEIMARIGYLFANSRAFGEGDTYIAMGISAFLGWQMLFINIALAIIIQAMVAIPIYFKKSLDNKNYKLCGAILTATIVVIFTALTKNYLPDLSLWALILYFAIIFIPIIASVIIILGSIKDKKEEELMTFPFGPALAISALIILFAQDYISNLLI